MRKTAFVLIFVIALIVGMSVSPILAYAADDDIIESAIVAGDIENMQPDVGYTLPENFDVEIAYYDYTLYSSGVYFAYELTFDKEYCSAHAESQEDYKNTVMQAAELFFSGRGFALIVDEENAKFTAQVRYDSKSDLYIANGIDGYERTASSPKTKKGFFFNEYTNVRNTVFARAKTPGYVIYGVVELCKALDISEERMLFKYVYGTPYKTISSDADETKFLTSRNIYTHSYTMTMEECDREITLKQVAPITANWYLVAIGVALIFAAAPLIVVIKRKKEVKNG